MPTIDSENAKQIRQPMDVLITMSLADDDISMTYSGYSSAKVADGKLDERGWPMRKLADLQGDGFPLDGSCVLYDSATTPSQGNGKLGVRSNVGQSVSVTATGSKVMASLTVLVTGASSVTYNGTTTDIVGNQVSIPVLSTSITMTFAPASQTERIEISAIFPDQEFRITNDNLIRATVSLRSDLSLFDQTLPESEINIEVYHGTDVSEEVANIPADTPIVYQAGYPGDMSPERKFYVSGQVTWADNVLSIHAVDAVHFLDDINIVAPITEKDSDYFANAVLWLLTAAGIDYDDRDFYTVWWSGAGRWIIREGTNARDYIAFMSQTFNLTDSERYLLDGSGVRLNDVLKFAYIDAGIPTVRTELPYRARPYQIQESDCANVQKSIEPPISRVNYMWERIIGNNNFEWSVYRFENVGSATWIKNVGTTLRFDKYTFAVEIGFYLGQNFDNENAKKLSNKWGYTTNAKVESWVPAASDGAFSNNPEDLPRVDVPRDVGYRLIKGEIPQEEFTKDDASFPCKIYTTFVPWSQRYNADWRNPPLKSSADAWNKAASTELISGSSQEVDLDLYGNCFNTETRTLAETRDSFGKTVSIDELPVIGEVYGRSDNNTHKRLFPEKTVAIPMYRSPITGSFTWKGDPRMQPRDVVEWERLDGTIEEITLENITLTHEGGGTSAEITYRKGVI